MNRRPRSVIRILLIEEEASVRERWTKALKAEGYQVLTAEHMAAAQQLLDTYWEESDLIVVDVMLPRNETDARQCEQLKSKRQPVYARWTDLISQGCSEDDPEMAAIRAQVASYDLQIAELLDRQGGLKLIEELARAKGTEGKLDKPVLYLTAREGREVREKGLALVSEGKARWLVKRVRTVEVLNAVRVLLAPASVERAKQ